MKRKDIGDHDTSCKNSGKNTMLAEQISDKERIMTQSFKVGMTVREISLTVTNIQK